MKSLLFPILGFALFFMACDKDNDDMMNPETNIPVVKSDATYEVLVEEDIIYAEGLSHQSLNSPNATSIPLKLDIYTPNNALENRPLFMLIHGGGFLGGTKQNRKIVDFANYYTSRGWVCLSIDYRVMDDFGTVPQEWETYAANLNLPDNKIKQFIAMYPANRDAKAAMRWIVANADTYKINKDFITVGGSSAGAITAITLGVSDQEDFRDELSIDEDPTLSTTNLEQSYQVQTIVDLWGSKVTLDAQEDIYGHQRFDSNDPSLFIVHGTEDTVVPFSGAEDLKTIYEANGIPLAYYPAQDIGHGAWDFVKDGKGLQELAFDFIVEQQKLMVE